MNGTDIKITPPTELQTQVCKCCGRELPVSQFGRGGYGLHKTCNECMGKKKSEGRKKRDEIADLRRQVEEARQLRLRDFQPRELMIRLRELGYEGVLTYTQRHEIDITKVD